MTNAPASSVNGASTNGLNLNFRNAPIDLVLEHLSNGGDLFGHSDNESLNELGLRYSTRFR